MADKRSTTLTEKDIVMLREVILQNPNVQVDNEALAKTAGYASPASARVAWYNLKKKLVAGRGQDAASPSSDVKKQKSGANADKEEAGCGYDGSPKRAKRSKGQKAGDASATHASEGGANGGGPADGVVKYEFAE